MKLHLHDWSHWSLPLTTYNGRKQQWRVCKVCNKASFRTLRWDQQTSLELVRRALVQVGAIQEGGEG